jgi:CDP-glucose 4,6-dehydratase
VGGRQSALENLEVMTLFGSAYNGKRVLVTGHTGFKGAWLCEWLLGLGAEVTGLSLPPPTEPSLFANSAWPALRHIMGDIQEPRRFAQSRQRAKPDFVFHLAAQALVRESYAARAKPSTSTPWALELAGGAADSTKPCAAVFITTDKCYENREWHHGYRETDSWADAILTAPAKRRRN